MGRLLQHLREEPSVRKERVRMKKLVLLGMIASLVLHPASVTRAADLQETGAESEEEMRERVFEEVLTGEITNDEDVIRVALEQYQERMNRRARMGSPELAEDEGLSITQVLDSYVDENGNVVEDVVTTGLLVMNENNNLLRGDFVSSGGAQLSEYSIYATMKVSVTKDTSYLTVRFNWFDTMLTYGTAMTAGSLTQDSAYKPNYGWEYGDIVKQISYPKSNVTYHYVPTNMDMISYGNFGGRSCRSIVNAGSRSFTMTFSMLGVRDFPDGEWYTEYN